MDQKGLNRTIHEAVRRLVKFYSPEKIYVFGSAATSEVRPDSDLDFLGVPGSCGFRGPMRNYLSRDV